MINQSLGIFKMFMLVVSYFHDKNFIVVTDY